MLQFYNPSNGLLIPELTDVFSLAPEVAGAQQQAERTTGRDVVEEEPHPYTISFFLFPHDQETNDSKKVDNSQLKNATNHSENAKGDKINAKGGFRCSILETSTTLESILSLLFLMRKKKF